MPELPEVETTLRGLNFLVNQSIIDIKIYQAKLREPISVKIYQLINQPIITIKRRAKYLIFCSTQGDLLVHLGMSGFFKLYHKKDYPDHYPKQNSHDRIDFYFADALLRYSDMRRFGLIQFYKDANQAKQLQNLGLEPLETNFNSYYLSKKLAQSKSAIKQNLMNSKIVVGVGNIYANESLFLAAIHPRRVANQLTQNEIVKLVKMIKQILYQAIEMGGTSLKDFKNSDGKLGYFGQNLKVYGRKNQPCFVCGHKIETIKIAGRSSFYCTTCQPLVS